MKNANFYYQSITGVWFRLDPYSDELYSKLRAELIIDNEVAKTWLLSEVAHKEIKKFDEPAIVNASVEYFIKLKFEEPLNLSSEVLFTAGLVFEEESSPVETRLYLETYQSK